MIETLKELQSRWNSYTISNKKLLRVSSFPSGLIISIRPEFFRPESEIYRFMILGEYVM